MYSGESRVGFYAAFSPRAVSTQNGEAKSRCLERAPLCKISP